MNQITSVVRKKKKIWALAAAAVALASMIQVSMPQQMAEARSLTSYFPGLEEEVLQGYYDGYSWGLYDGQSGYEYGAHYPYSESGCFTFGWGYYSGSAECVYEYGFSLGYTRGWNAA